MEEIKELKEIKENLRKTFGTEDFGEIQSQVKKLVYELNAMKVVIKNLTQFCGTAEFVSLVNTNFNEMERQKRRQAEIESGFFTDNFCFDFWEIAEKMEEQFKRGNNGN